MNLTAVSKFLSYVLRHHPEAIGLEIDENGWAKVDVLIEKAKKNGKNLDREVIQQIIEKSSKKRFIFSSDGEYIRAGYGHSMDVDLKLKSKAPPEKLFHGTASDNISAIIDDGIRARNRNFVHLSSTIDEARNVGGRHGRPVILRVLAQQMNCEGFDFYQSESEESIWLTKYVPPEYIDNQ